MKKQLIIKLLFLFLILTGLGFSDYMINQQVIINQKNNVQLDELSSRNNNLLKLQKEYLDIAEDVPAIKQLLPTKDNLPITIEEIENIAHQNNLTINIDFSSEDKTTTGQASTIDRSGPRNIIFTIGVSGNEGDVLNFYKNLEQGHYFLQVEKYDFIAPDGLNKTIAVSFNVKLYVDPNFTI
jgi:hypothetical protein